MRISASIPIFIVGFATMCSGFQSQPATRRLYLPRNAVASSDEPSQSSLDDRAALDRRTILATSLLSSLAVLQPTQNSGAVETQTETVAPVTQKLTMDVRISRQDGTFYVRDDLPDTPENRVFYGRLTIGLFGSVAPNSVRQFLSYADVQYLPLDDNPLPSYSRSTFVSLDQSTGLLMGGYIPSLEVINFGGSTAIKYGGRISPAKLWGESSNDKKLSHNAKGLLTHRILEVNPTFGITTRPNPELDGTNTVFGQILFDDSSREFLRLCDEIPTYSMERPMGDPRTETAVDVVAASIFNSQREFFRGAAKTLGDDRVSKVYNGKLLRRVEVTKVELI